MLFKNALIYGPDYTFQPGDLAVADGRFADRPSGGTVIDLAGKKVIPGLIDIHFHGNSGADFSDGDYAGLLKIARYLLQKGITSFSPASMTLPEKELAAAFATAIRLQAENPADCSVIRGITMEGPFFNPEKKGAQNAAHLQLPDFAFFQRLNEAASSLVKIACVAPELPGALDFIQKTASCSTLSLAHTNANYDQAKAGIDAGASHVTHLFNAMPPLHHREPGVIGAAAENPAVTAELIVDGIHIHPSSVRAAFALFGADRMVLVSDSIRACGMADGEYNLGGQQVFVKGRRATLADGTIAGSATDLFACLRTAISFDIPAEAAIRAATINPAKVIGVADQVGSISSGKLADFIILHDDWSIAAVYKKGRLAV